MGYRLTVHGVIVKLWKAGSGGLVLKLLIWGMFFDKFITHIQRKNMYEVTLEME